MKMKTKLLIILSTIVTTSAFGGLLTTNNNSQSLNANVSEISSVNNNLTKKEFKGQLLGANGGTFTIEYSDVDHCTITDISYWFDVYGDWNMNGGKFTSDRITYTITKIGKGAFSSSGVKHFHDVYLTIPSTIKEIGDEAFYGCSRNRGNKEIRAINFEEGVEYIGRNAFYKCSDLQEKYIKLPNSLKSIWFDSFSKAKVERFDLIGLDHVIKVNNLEGQEYNYNDIDLNKIYFKSEEIKQKYLKAESWRLSSPIIFRVRENPFPKIQRLTIDAKLIGGKTGTITLDVTEPNNSVIKECSDDFTAYGNFNFNGGHFTYAGTQYTITEIDHEAFKASNTRKYFHNVYLTIPSTIKEIGIGAFNNCSRNDVCKDKEIRAVNFEEGVEYIHDKAFKKCLDFEQKIVKLSNSLKYLGDNIFIDTKIEKVDLTALDHVIPTKCDVIHYEIYRDSKREYGCMYTGGINTRTDNDLKKIYFKDENMKDKYCANEHWKPAEEFFEIKK